MDRADVVIVGAGAIGVCTAHYLAGSTRRIVVVEKGEVCSGCSYGNAGLLVPSHCVPLAEPRAVAQGLRQPVGTQGATGRTWSAPKLPVASRIHTRRSPVSRSSTSRL